MKIKLLDYKKLKETPSVIPVDFFKDSKSEDVHLAVFFDRINQSGIGSLNIVASATVDGNIVFCNSSNTAEHVNQIIITSLEFWKDQANAPLSVFPIELDVEEKTRIDITSMVYSIKNDCMVFMASANASAGQVKSSSLGYIGILEHFARKIGRKKMKVNELTPLSEIDKKFKDLSGALVALSSDKDEKIKIVIYAQNEKGIGYQIKLRIKM